MDTSTSGTNKSPNTSLSFRYNANNEELEELYDICEDDPPTPQFDASPTLKNEHVSPKRSEKNTSILDKYFKSMRTDKLDDIKPVEKENKDKDKSSEENRSPPKDVSSSPMKEYLKNLGKRNSETTEAKEGATETWRIFHDFRFKISQAVEDMKTKSVEETKEKFVPRDNSVSDSEENSAIKDSDQSVGDTDNQVSSLNSSMQNLSEATQPLTAKAAELPTDPNSEASDNTHKNMIDSYMGDEKKENNNSFEVESGVEALEDAFDAFDQGTPKMIPQCPNPCVKDKIHCPFTTEPIKKPDREHKNQESAPILNYTLFVLTLFLCVSFCLFSNWNVWNGFVLGLWAFCFTHNIKEWVIENYFTEEPHRRKVLPLHSQDSLPTYTIPSVKEYKPLKKYGGWINHYRYPDYDPTTYHISKTTTAFMKLEGHNLRISYTTMKVAKRALWNEKIDKVVFYQHRLYNLMGARVILLPNGLVRRRQWSKKYPICVILNEEERIQILEKDVGQYTTDRKTSESISPEKRKESSPEMESAETNTSPEKKKKFVWRKRDKSVHSENELSREGLRHRLVRKKHKDKKTDSVSTSTDHPESGSQVPERRAENAPEVEDFGPTRSSVTSTRDDDDEIDETELSRIKEFLEEAEMETGADCPAEGEWSLHIKNSKDKHAHLYLFARTGREKHDWYRRLLMAISDANHADFPIGEDKSMTESAHDNKDNKDKDHIEMAVYHHHASEKESVTFTKNKMSEENVAAPIPPITSTRDVVSDEEVFWPYFLKIIQSKTSSPSCDCRMLPAEVTWVNMLFARMLYDVMRDAAIKKRLQMRIQRKLHTMKLPAFMSPLVVTELSLTGACPLVERVSPPSWDERGLWLDADLQYAGGAYITILTQINLMKLKEKNVSLEDHMRMTAESEHETSDQGHKSPVMQRSKPAVYDSDIEDSAESSTDDESPLVQPVDSAENILSSETGVDLGNAPSSSKKKFLRMVDKIATNKYFQQVTDYKYVKRAMEGLSNTDIKLQLEVQGLEGRLTLNMPPPTHDRMWLGFRTNPQLILKARPTVGARALRFAQISNWIEQKLTKEFEKVLVLPNMEDIIIGCMTPTPIEFE